MLKAALLSVLVLVLVLFVTLTNAAARGRAAPAVNAAPPAAAPSSAPSPPKADDEDDEPAAHEPVTYTVNIDLESLSKFDLGPGTLNAELVLDVDCDHEPCDPHLEIGNGKQIGKADKIGSGALSKRWRVNAELDAYVDLAEYPFDSHELQIELYDTKDPFQTKLKVGEISIGPRVRLPGWELDEPRAGIEQIDDGDDQKQDQFVFAIALRRPRLAQTFKSLVPVIAMIFVAAVGLMLRPKSITARFNASTGGLVPLVMFHVGQINSLPSVGYLTRLDKLMVAAYLVFVVHIVFNTLMLRSEEVKDEAASAKLYKIAAIAVPASALVFILLAAKV